MTIGAPCRTLRRKQSGKMSSDRGGVVPLSVASHLSSFPMSYESRIGRLQTAAPDQHQFDSSAHQQSRCCLTAKADAVIRETRSRKEPTTCSSATEPFDAEAGAANRGSTIQQCFFQQFDSLCSADDTTNQCPSSTSRKPEWHLYAA